MMLREEEEPNPYLLPRSCKCGGPNCSHTRGQVNHWFILLAIKSVENTQFTLRMPAAINQLPSLVILPFDINLLLDYPEAVPVCGQECGQRLIARFMTDGRLTG